MAIRTIAIKVHENSIQEESTLTAVIVYPGMLLERASATTVQAHSTAGGPSERLICLEDEGQGKEVKDGYAASTRVRMLAGTPGDKVAVKVTDADSSVFGTISVGDFLESNGDGYWRIWSYGAVAGDSSGVAANNVFPQAVALEAIDMADSSGIHGNGLIAARLI